MKAELEKGQDGFTSVAIRADYGVVGRLTPHEAEQFMKELRRTINQAQAANTKPRKVGDY